MGISLGILIAGVKKVEFFDYQIPITKDNMRNGHTLVCIMQPLFLVDAATFFGDDQN